MSSDMMIVDETDISTAWARVLLKFTEPGINEITPLVVSVAIGDDPLPERTEIRTALDDCLRRFVASNNDRLNKLQKVHTVANTIFPSSFWNPNAENDADLLYERFDAAWPRLKRCSQNRRGSYFRRLTSYRAKNNGDPPVNQLKHVIETYRDRNNHRRSALIASIFDPALDHNHSNRGMGFPCLHQVTFAPVGTSGLTVTGFYAMQHILDRAYGNYLGLCRLGQFVSTQLGLNLVKMTCVASTARLGNPNKGDVAALANELTPLISDGEEPSA